MIDQNGNSMFQGLLILGSRSDPHVRSVEEKLSKREVDVLVLDCFEPINFSFSVDRQGNSVLKVGEHSIADNVTLWHRVKIIPNSDLFFTCEKRSIPLVWFEWSYSYSMISKFFSGRSYNNFDASTAIQNKAYQQHLAASVGLKVPSSIISNNSVEIRSFASEYYSLIMKSNANGYVLASLAEELDFAPDGRFVCTMPLTSDDLSPDVDKQLEVCPHFLQENIDKDYELRITVVGKKAFAFSIPSQEFEVTKIDWRLGTDFLKFSYTELPKDVEKKIFKLIGKMNLSFGCIDIIVDKKGEHWFLECNSDGQWMWLDSMVDDRISHAYADFFYDLIRKRNQS